MKNTEYDAQKLDAYAKAAKAQWGDTAEYQAYEAKKLSPEQQQNAAAGLMERFRPFAALKDGAPDAPEAQAAVQALKDYISEHFYPCSDTVLAGLGKLYGAGGEFTENIDAYAGAGTAAFAAKAIEAACKAHN